MKYIQTHEPCTYEELGDIFGTTPNKVHAEVKSSFNCMVRMLADKEGFSVYDSVFALVDFFGMTEKEAVNKLDRDLRNRIMNEAIDRGA